MAETTGKIILSYDINGKHSLVKAALIAIGYSNVTMSLVTYQTYDMPNTTLWHLRKQVSQGIADIESVCSRLDVRLEKAVAVLVQEESAYYNE